MPSAAIQWPLKAFGLSTAIILAACWAVANECPGERPDAQLDSSDAAPNAASQHENKKDIDPRWGIVLSEWSMRSEILRPRANDGTLGVARFAERARELDIANVELSSQLLEVDIRRQLAAQATDDEKEGDERPEQGELSEKPTQAELVVARERATLKQMRDALEDVAVVQITIDHLRPLSVGGEEDDANGEDVANVEEYARWIQQKGVALGSSRFSLVVTENGLDRDTASTRAVEAISGLATMLSREPGTPMRSDHTDDRHESTRAHNKDKQKPSSDSEQGTPMELDKSIQPSDSERIRSTDQRKLIKNEPPHTGDTKDLNETFHILLESGDGFRSDPRWLARIVRGVRQAFVKNNIDSVQCSVLLNIADVEAMNELLQGWEVHDNAPILGGVIAQTRSFIVAPLPDNPKLVNVVAEREVDYDAKLRALTEFAAIRTPIVVRYVGPARYEKSGIAASISLFRMLLTEPEEQ